MKSKFNSIKILVLNHNFDRQILHEKFDFTGILNLGVQTGFRSDQTTGFRSDQNNRIRIRSPAQNSKIATERLDMIKNHAHQDLIYKKREKYCPLNILYVEWCTNMAII